MKKISLLLIVLSLFLGNINAAEAISNVIRIDKNKNMLVAPTSGSYEWYYNNEKLDISNQKIKVVGEGFYKVVLTDENGEVTSQIMNVALNSQGVAYRIIIIGDSTVQGWGGGWYPQEGWGATLPYFFDENVTVINRSRSARSARSYYNEQDWWPVTKEMIQPGDFVFIGFGINDAAKTYDRFTEPFDTNVNTGYKYYLKRYIKETQERGGFPVIVTTVRRCSFNANGTVYDSWHDYPVASRQMAHEYNLPYIDLDSASVPLYETMGEDYIAHFLHNVYDPGEYPNYPEGKTDYTHFQESGCVEICRLVTDEIKKYKDDTTMNRLIPHIKPIYEVTTSTNFPDLAQLTRTQSFPEGAPVTIKVRIADTIDLVRWEDGSGSEMSTSNVYRFTMGAEPLSLNAVIDDDPVYDCTGVPNGEAYIDDCGECVAGSTGKVPCVTDLTDGNYKMVSVRSEYCLKENKDGITQEVCMVADSQMWKFEKDGTYYKIKNVGSGNYMAAQLKIAKAPIESGADPILWRLEADGDNTYQFIVSTDMNISAEIYTAKRDVGTPLYLNLRSKGSNQKFILYKDNATICGVNEVSCLSINNLELTNNIQVAPNPMNYESILTVDLYNNQYFDFDVYDLQGKIVFQQHNITNGEVTFGKELQRGLYFGKITIDQKSKTVKIIKN